jgi:hypothetical protein
MDFVAEAGASRKSVGPWELLWGLKLSGERDGGLGLARLSAVCPFWTQESESKEESDLAGHLLSLDL